ncbi:MAG: restriction endonuclease subunit S [Bacteroidota bacterium]
MSWELVSLRDITINLDNKRKPLNENERNRISNKKLYPYIGANNILSYVDEYIFDEEILCIAEDGGSWGENQKCCFYVNEKCWVNNHAHVLKSNGLASLKYIMYYLNMANLNSYITGSTRGKLTKSALESIQIPLPPLPVQKRIAEILDAADALRRKDLELLNKYDELAQAIFIDMFGDPVKNEKGWEVKELKDVCVKITDGTHHTPSYVSTGVPFLRVTDITGSSDSKKYISTAEHNELIKRCNPEYGDVLYTKNGTIGIAKAVDWNYDFSIFVSLCLLKINKKLLRAKFVEYFLNTPLALRQALKHSKTGTVTNLHLVEIKSIKIPVPPIHVQDEFIDQLTLISENENVSQHSDMLFSSLLQKAFKGELC